MPSKMIPESSTKQPNSALPGERKSRRLDFCLDFYSKFISVFRNWCCGSFDSDNKVNEYREIRR